MLQPPAPSRSPTLPRKSQLADAKCRKPASDPLDVRQAVLARRHCPGTHRLAPCLVRRHSAGKEHAADRLPWPGQRRAQDRRIHSARHGKPDTVAGSGRGKPSAVPQDGIARPQSRLDYTNWSRPISRLV
jgi:hypothetical protein